MNVPSTSAKGARRQVAVVTGSRAEYGLLEGIIENLRASSWAEPRIIVSGMHLVSSHGHTVEEVERAYPVAAQVPMNPEVDSRAGMARAVSDGLAGFTDALSEIDPHLLLVLGDRTEAFAAALAAAYLEVPVAHVHGGDVSGNDVDDFQRDAISRLARLHFPATKRSAARLEELSVTGQMEIVGAPGLDRIVSRSARSRGELAAALELPDGPWVVVLHHPNPSHPERAAAEMREVVKAARRVAESRCASLVLLYPNNDAGHQGVLEVIEDAHPAFDTFVFKSLARGDYLDLLEHAELLLGNSSSGLIESASLGLPVVNVGDRQDGRERDDNVVDSPPREEAIVSAASRALSDRSVQAAAAARHSCYGDGHSSERIVASLRHFLVGSTVTDGVHP